MSVFGVEFDEPFARQQEWYQIHFYGKTAPTRLHSWLLPRGWAPCLEVSVSQLFEVRAHDLAPPEVRAHEVHDAVQFVCSGLYTIYCILYTSLAPAAIA